MSMTPDEAWEEAMSNPLGVAVVVAAAYAVAKTEFMEEFGIDKPEDIEPKLGADFARFIDRLETVGMDLTQRKIFNQ
jgi:hypothetical protein